MKLLIASEHGIVYKPMLLFKCWSPLLLFYIFVGSKIALSTFFPFVGITEVKNSPKIFSNDRRDSSQCKVNPS